MARRKRKPTIRANFYSIERIIYRKRKYIYITNPKGYLFSGASTLVKITKEDLPKCFVPARYKKCFGFLRTNRVKSLVYIPNHSNSHFLKDDVLLISYRDEIVQDPGDLYGFKNYQLYIFGLDILTFLKSIRLFSPEVDVSRIEERIRNKKQLLMESNKEIYSLEAENVNLDSFFSYKQMEVAY